jgi:hypothetical protein
MIIRFSLAVRGRRLDDRTDHADATAVMHAGPNWVATTRRRDLIPAGSRRKDANPAAGNGQGLFLAPAVTRG